MENKDRFHGKSFGVGIAITFIFMALFNTIVIPHIGERKYRQGAIDHFQGKVIVEKVEESKLVVKSLEEK